MVLRLVVLFFLCISPAFAQITDPLLFKVSYEGKESLLLGSCHSISLSEFSPLVKDKLLSSKTLVLEGLETFSDLSKERLKELPILRQNRGEPWFEELSSQLQDYLVKEFEPLIQAFHPELKVRDLEYWAAFLKYNSPSHFGMDYELQHKHFKNSEKHALETLESAMNLIRYDVPNLEVFRKILTQDYAYYLKTGHNYQTSPEKDKLMAPYREGDIEALKPKGDWPFKISTGARNLKWLPKIIHLHKAKPQPLFVVGCYHLFGKKGILNLLREQGFKIQKMNDQGEFSSLDLESYL